MRGLYSLYNNICVLTFTHRASRELGTCHFVSSDSGTFILTIKFRDKVIAKRLPNGMTNNI